MEYYYCCYFSRFPMINILYEFEHMIDEWIDV